MQDLSYCHAPSSTEHDSVTMTGNEGGMQDNIIRLREERKRLRYTPTQVWKLVEAGGYDISEATVRRFFDDESTYEPQQHTVDVISAVLFSTSRDEFDPSQAHRYFREAAELKISMTSLQQSVAHMEGMKVSYDTRLKLYEEAIAFYRQHIADLIGLIKQKQGGNTNAKD